MKYFLPVLLILAACGKDTKYVHQNSGFQEIFKTESHAVVGDGGQVDILWVIDNSGSMSDIQNNVKANADKFMQEFLKNKALNWRMGLLSTDESQRPYLGFDSIFDQSDVDPVATFRQAVARLGINGSGSEKSFKPVQDKLNSYANFLRPSAHLIVIFVTDEKEQSRISAQDFLKYLLGKKNNRVSLVHAYGAFQATDFSCPDTAGYEQVTYAGSPFEEVIVATNGKAYSTCTPNFGSDMASLGNDIVNAISSPIIMLEKRPMPTTIKVVYKGVELAPGPKDKGGLWVYDSEANGVRFHNMEFVDFNERSLNITYEVDQGQQ